MVWKKNLPRNFEILQNRRKIGLSGQIFFSNHLFFAQDFKNDLGFLKNIHIFGHKRTSKIEFLCFRKWPWGKLFFDRPKKILENLDSPKKNTVDSDQRDFWASTWVQSEMAYPTGDLLSKEPKNCQSLTVNNELQIYRVRMIKSLLRTLISVSHRL